MGCWAEICCIISDAFWLPQWLSITDDRQPLADVG
jgi:hypothetical protein